MKFKQKFWSLFLSLLFLGCHDFYNGYQDGDLWRLPLLEPYELRNIAGATPAEKPNSNWDLILQTLKVDSITNHLNITMVNVDKGIIYGYGNLYPGYHFIINWNTKSEMVYKDTTLWEKELIRLQVDGHKIYNVWGLFGQFKLNGHLEWH